MNVINNIDKSSVMHKYPVSYRHSMNKQNLVNEESVNKCLEYVSEGKELFKDIIKSLKVTTKLLDTNYFFDDDKDIRNIYRVFITRKGKTISFKFGDSIDATLKGEEPSLYDLLTIVSSEYDFNDSTFEEFCDEFGYDIDSRKAEKIYKNWTKQNIKFKKIFQDSEIEVFPH